MTIQYKKLLKIWTNLLFTNVGYYGIIQKEVMNVIYNGDLRDSTNFRSEKYIQINSCNIQQSRGKAHTAVRNVGRVDYHILYIAEGECLCLYENVEYTMKKGDFVLYPPETKQRYMFMEGTAVTSMWVHFAGVGIEDLLTELGLGGGVFTSALPVEAEHYFRKMINASSLNMPKNSVSARGYLLNLLSSLSCGVSGYISSDFSGAVVKMIEYINFNWQKTLSVAEVSEAASLSESRAAHLFKESVGESIHRYISGIKIENSKELLLNTDMSVSEISAMIGYDDPLYFSRLFKSFVGVSPKKFKKEKELSR